jgi:hypothetical protein
MAGGFGSYLIAMDERTYELIGADYPGNRAEDVKNPGLVWMIGFLFVVSFLGLFSLVPLRKVADALLNFLLSLVFFFFSSPIFARDKFKSNLVVYALSKYVSLSLSRPLKLDFSCLPVFAFRLWSWIISLHILVAQQLQC